MSSKKDPSGGVPANSKGSWTSFLKSIASFNGDLSSLTAPPFILSSTSLTEYSAYWAEHPAVFVAPAREADPEKRALLVLKWFLTTLHQQYCSRSEKLGSEKKPLNPFLGELFIGKWQADESDPELGETTLVSEQVSHHPPATAYAIRNEKHGVELQGYNAQKASFSSTIQVKQIGHALYTLTLPGTQEKERYLITLPNLHIESLIYGTPFVELEKTAKIASSNGYVSKIDFSGKGWLSGKKNTFTACLYKANEGEKHPIYTIDGQWSNTFTVKNAKKEEVDKWVVAENKTTPLTLAPLEEQDLYESRRAWKDVAENIQKSDMDAVSAHKSRIENAQRELRRIEKSEGREWERRFFSRIDPKDDDPEVQKLANALDLPSNLDGDKTGGIWRFDAQRAAGAQPPYFKVGGEGLGLE
ncbi:hypothetical protein N7523_006273 [Penicillium sp. IBT 18751x]|nr:hypothetical protein N7523_006273 [Penicillium sp. IBT 18751x]